MLESPFNKLTGLKACGWFFVNIAKFLRTACFIEHLWWLLLKMVEALKRQNKKIRTAATVSTIYMRFLHNLFVFGVLTSALHFSSTFLTLIYMKYFRNVTAWNGSPRTHKRKCSIKLTKWLFFYINQISILLNKKNTMV